MAREHSFGRLKRQWLLFGLVCASLGSAAGTAVDCALVDDILRAADRGQCIESVTFRMIQSQGRGQAAAIVRAALGALGQREQQQRSLGCAGDIAAQAIAAGADPDEVLEATAAGL